MFRPNDQIGPYTLVRKLGQGSFGVAWLAERRGAILTTPVALKLPLDDNPNLDVIKREASAWLQASGHPNVMPVIEADVYDGQVVIVTEYAPEGSLAEWMKQHNGKAPTLKTAVQLMNGILSGLEHLHSRDPKLIHRDLKPANILMSGQTPRLTDFGLARVLKSADYADYTVHESGTPAYMPPEAFQGRYSEQTDIWAAGVIFYALLAGRLPFPQQDLPSLYGAITQCDPDPLPAMIPDTLRQVIDQALHKDRTRRYHSVAEMREALAPLLVTSLDIDLTDRSDDLKSELDKQDETVTEDETVSDPVLDKVDQQDKDQQQQEEQKDDKKIQQQVAPKPLPKNQTSWLSSLAIIFVIFIMPMMNPSMAQYEAWLKKNHPLEGITFSPTLNNKGLGGNGLLNNGGLTTNNGLSNNSGLSNGFNGSTGGFIGSNRFKFPSNPSATNSLLNDLTQAPLISDSPITIARYRYHNYHWLSTVTDHSDHDRVIAIGFLSHIFGI